MTGDTVSGSPHGDAVRPDDDTTRVLRVFPRVTTAVADARDWVSTFLRERSMSQALIDDAALVASELVTNALRHGLGEVVVRATVDGGREVHLAVTDAGPELPTLLDPDPERLGGVGLRIVDELALRWGTSAFPGGKTVWVVLAENHS
jgi:anti-sigma regulatory factor (Ser/Thr protein kinase)